MKRLLVFTTTLFLASPAMSHEVTEMPTPLNRSVESDFSQLFFIQGGPFTPKAVTVSNGDYRFQYKDDSLQSLTIEAGWALRLFKLFGTFHFEQNLAFSSLQGTAPTSVRGLTEVQNLRLFMAGLDGRLMYSMDWFPWKRFIPFADGGYRFTLYNQSGPSDLESAQGGVGNGVAGVGFRFWLNRGTFTNERNILERYTTIPIFLTAKYNHIFDSGEDINLESDTYLAGLAIAL